MGISSLLGSSALLPAGLGFRNLIINGNMRIAQRGTAAVTTTDGFAVDRWKIGIGTTGAWTAQQVTTASVATLGGFDYAYKFTKTTGNTPAAGDYNYIVHAVEGNNIAGLSWGTSGAKPVTLSFWVYSGATGTFGGSIRTPGVTWWAYPFSYTVNAPITWEYKTITIPGATSGSWPTDNTTGFALFFDLGSGANARLTAGSWQSGTNCIGASGTSQYPTNTSGGYLYITGVQLEQNYQPTPFEQRPIGVELVLCQRYYEISNGIVQVTAGATGFGGNTYWSWMPYGVEKRISLNYSTNTAANGLTIKDNAGVANQLTYWKSATQYTATNIGFEVYTNKGHAFVFNGGQTDAGLARYSWVANAEL